MHSVFDVVTPVFGIVALGFALARMGVFGPAASEALTRFMFYVAVPAMLFNTLATTPLPQSVPWAYICAFYGASFATFAFGVALARYHYGWSRKEQGIAGITAGYSNMVMLGFPLVIMVFGEAGALPLFILLALQSLLMFPVTTWLIELGGETHDGASPRIVAAIGKLLLNPVIASLLLGIFVNLLGIETGGAFARGLEIVGAAAPACALTALGVGLAQYEIRGAVRESAGFVVLKTIVHPVLVWAACAVLDVPVLWAQVAILLAAMPTGINAFIFARQYQLRVEVVSKTIVISTGVSVLSVIVLVQRFLT